MSTISAEDRIPVERVPKTQALVSKTFTSPPLDGSLHPAELYKWNSDNNSDHPLFLFDDDGEVTTIRWPETVEAINCGVKRVRKIMNWSVGLYKPPIIGILAASDTITYFVMMTAIYRAGYVAFPISPRNSPAAIAHLVKELDVRHILVGQEPKVQGLASEALKRLSTSIVQPQTSNMPLFDDLYGQPKVSPQDIVYERRGINDVIIYLHSSGSTSHPKPIPITNRRFLELSLAYHFGDVDVTGLIFSLHIVPMFHALGVMQMACIVSTGIVASVFKPQFPAQVPGVKAHYDASVATDTDVVISVPSIIEEWAANLECVRWLASRTGVICGGGSLSDSVGSYLASQGVNTNTLYGSTECGGMSSILTTKSIDDWGYFAFARNITPQLIPQGDGICELILVSQPFCKLLVTNTTVGGMNAFATSDLLVRHPTNPDLWKIYGRSDDQIIHTTGEKTNPCPLEAILNQDPHIKGAVMFGHRRSRAGFVVEPHPSFAFDIKDEVKLADFCNKIWPSVQKANAFAPQHSRVFQDMIIAADCSKSFTYTAKGTARRQAVLEDYEVEISQLYDSISALSQEPVPLPSNWSPETTHDFVRKVVSSTLATAVSDRGDLFHAGCDSLQATQIQNILLRALRDAFDVDTRTLDKNFVYACPTIFSLTDFFLHSAYSAETPMAVSATREERMCQMVEHYAQSLPTKTFGPPVPPIHLIGVSLNRCAEDEDASKIPDVSIVESSAEMLYGLVHQRFILTRAGLQAMAEKYENGVFGSCPRVYCVSCNVVPCGRSDMPGVDTVKLFCPNCNDIFVPPSSRFQGVDGAFFGTTFAHLFFQTYRELAPAPFWKAPISGGSPLSPRSGGSSNSARVSPFVNPNPHGGQKRANGFVYVPRIYGFKVSERAKSGPRMQWLRLRPESPEELDMVDYRGTWIDEDDDYDDTEEEEEEDRQMEDFDAEAADPDEDDDEEEEEEEERNIPVQERQRGQRHVGFKAAELASPTSTTSSPVSSVMPLTPKDREDPPRTVLSHYNRVAVPDRNSGGKVKSVRQWTSLGSSWGATAQV